MARLSRIRGAFLALPPLLLFLAVAVTTHPNLEFRKLTDGWFYYEMADRASAPQWMLHHRPWSLRVLTPWIVSVLPFERLTSFLILSLSAHVLNLILLAAILRHYKSPENAITFASLLYVGVYWTVKWSLYAPTYIDSSTLLGTFVITYLALSRSFVVLPAVLALATLQKESVIFLAPFVAAVFASPERLIRHRQAQCYLALLVAVWGGTIAILQCFHAELTARYSPEAAVGQVISRYFLDPGFYPRLLFVPCSAWGILPVLLALRFKQLRAAIEAEIYWGVYLACALVVALGGWDTERLLLGALPVLLVLTARAYEPELRSLRPRTTAFFVIAFAAHCVLGNQFFELGSTTEFYEYTRPTSSHQLGALAVRYVICIAAVAVSYFVLLFPQRTRVRLA